MLVVDDLTKRFPGRSLPAIAGIDLEVRDGEIHGLVGLNGAGKTTTIRVAAGISLPSSGRVLVDGRDIVREKRVASARIGWVPELFPFEFSARALPLMVYHAGFYGLSGSDARTRCRELLSRVGLHPVERDRIGTFSQGMRKRFSLAIAMISDPPNLLLDEILNGLDPGGIAYVRSWVMGLRQQGKAVLLSSHLLTELEAIADRVTFVHEGRALKTVNMSALAAEGEIALRIRIGNLDADGTRYLESVGKVQVNGTTILLLHPTAEPSVINAELVRRGYRISELRIESTSLEAYFLALIGEAR